MSYSRNSKYLWSLTPGIFTILGNTLGTWWVLSNLIYSLVFLAILEFFMPEDKRNDQEEDSALPDFILFTHVVFQIIALSCFFISIYQGRISGYFLLFASISTGVHTGSSSIIVAHELIHRKARIWQVLGKFLLFTAGNIYFFVDHLRVHHKWVGTDKDPATAKKGESVYSFFIRSTVGQIISSWNVEKSRLAAMNKSVWSIRNYVFRSCLILASLFIAIYLSMGSLTLAAFLLQCLVANFLLEYTNYIEHYGLVRTDNSRVNVELSWQSDKVLSRFILIDLSRHSDHHFYASKPYHTLCSHDESPVLPAGYASCIYLAMIPPLWYKMIHPRIESMKKIEIKPGTIV